MSRFGVTLVMFGLVASQLAYAPRASADGDPVFGCPGDCNYDGRVGLSELMIGVRRGLGQTSIANPCVPIERQCDGVVSIDDLVDAVVASDNQCQGYPTKPASLPFGIYDATTVATAPGESFTLDTLASVDSRFAPFEMRLRLTTLASAYAYGAFSADGRICAEGSYIEGDIFFPMRGILTYDAEDATVAGSMIAQRLFTRDEIELDVTVTRAATPPATHAGNYSIAVVSTTDESGARSTIGLPVRDIDALGVGNCGPAVETDSDGMRIATIAGGRCWISPRGRIDFFSSEYLAEDINGCVAPMRFLGRLGGGVESSGGELFVGLVPPACFLGATWSVGAL